MTAVVAAHSDLWAGSDCEKVHYSGHERRKRTLDSTLIVDVFAIIAACSCQSLARRRLPRIDLPSIRLFSVYSFIILFNSIPSYTFTNNPLPLSLSVEFVNKNPGEI